MAQPSLSEAQVKAALLLNFARYTELPDTSANVAEPFTLCQLGRDAMGAAFTNLESKQVGGRPVKVKTLATVEDVRGCQVVFIADSEERRIVPLIKSLADKPILTVSDIAGFVEAGGCIGIVQGEPRLQFDVNRRALEQGRIKASSNLLKLARKLNESTAKN
jgi:hypothetical protein